MVDPISGDAKVRNDRNVLNNKKQGNSTVTPFANKIIDEKADSFVICQLLANLYGLLNDAVRRSDYITSNDRMISE
jgi:hypothetical protein